jgi:hypothetical protein
MGYPMTYSRVVYRNGLLGDYVGGTNHPPDGYKDMIAGDLRRLEKDQRDEQHLAEYAKRTGLTPEQVKSVLDLLFDLDPAHGGGF